MNRVKDVIKLVSAIALTLVMENGWAAEKVEGREDSGSSAKLAPSGEFVSLKDYLELKSKFESQQTQLEEFKKQLSSFMESKGSEKGEEKTGGLNLSKGSPQKTAPAGSANPVKEGELAAEIEKLKKVIETLQADMAKILNHYGSIYLNKAYVLKDLITTDKIKWIMYGATIWYGCSEGLAMYLIASNLPYGFGVFYAAQRGVIMAWNTFGSAYTGGYALQQMSTVATDIKAHIGSTKKK